MGRGSNRELIRVKPGAAAAVHSKAAQMQNAAGGAGVRVNRVLTASARPLAKTRLHSEGKRAAKNASAAVASCANNARRLAQSAAPRNPAGDVGMGLFEMVASAPVFVAQALHSPKYMSSTPPQLPPPPPPPQALPPPPPPTVAKPPRPSHSKPIHHNVHWAPVQQALKPNGKPYKPPPGYPAAKKHRKKKTSSRKRS